MRLERGDGQFTGMSQDGAIVIVRNVGPTACTIPALPSLMMRNAEGVIVARGVPRGARFMHPGPVALPLKLDAGDLAAAKINWIVGDVFGQAPAHSVTTTSLVLAIGGSSVTIPLRAELWGQSGDSVTFVQDHFTTSPPPLAAPSDVIAGTFVGEGPAGATYLSSHDQPARRLVLREAPDGRFTFSFDGLSGLAPSTGSIAGPLLVHGSQAIFESAVNNCKLAVSFFGPQLVVKQMGNCGFGNGVTATGQYRKL